MFLDVFCEKYYYREEEVCCIVDFFSLMFEFVLEKRVNVGGMVGYVWLDDMFGMRGVKIFGLEVGSRGDGIDGWVMEVRK